MAPAVTSPRSPGGMQVQSGGQAMDSAAPRMLRVQFGGQPYDWFNLDEMGDAIRSEDFANTLRENIVHYFSVPFDCQAICDEDGPLCTAMDFARALRAARPCLIVSDIREMPADAKDRLAQKLALVTAEVARFQRNVGALGSSMPLQGIQSARPVSPRAEPSTSSLADRLGSSGGSRLPLGSSLQSQSQMPPYGGPCGSSMQPGPSMQSGYGCGSQMQMGDAFGRPAGPMSSNMQSAAQNALFNAIDTNHDGQISRREFSTALSGGVQAPGQSRPWSATSGGAQPSSGLNRIASLRHYDVGGGMRPGEPMEVMLAKDPNDYPNSRFGFANVPATNGGALLITWTDPSGLLAKWNREHPDKQVREGDMIIAVNSATENVEQMRNELHEDSIRMLVQLGNGAPGGNYG